MEGWGWKGSANDGVSVEEVGDRQDDEGLNEKLRGWGVVRGSSNSFKNWLAPYKFFVTFPVARRTRNHKPALS